MQIGMSEPVHLSRKRFHCRIASPPLRPDEYVTLGSWFLADVVENESEQLAVAKQVSRFVAAQERIVELAQ
ncbi:UNVERIFIED_CONTAM: hypothetical protein PYX00_009533 [Menopon gallinae]|uniref:Uncharacterized protein n=1 Tax=Menopon gallinae TaxID=328185 RepID=A0AAW2HBL5_9NEOP